MKDTHVDPKEVLNIETSFIGDNSHPNNKSTLLNTTNLRNLIGNKPNNNINIRDPTILGTYKTKRNNTPLEICLQNTNDDIKDIPERQPAKSEIYISVDSETTTSVGHDHLPAEIIKLRIDMY